MRAMVAPRYGGPEVLELRELPDPVPGPGQVVLRVRGTSVQPLDWHLLRGRPLLVRLVMGLRRPKREVMGADLAGVVVAVGPDVDGLAPGDEVVCVPTGEGGGLAELVAVPAGHARPKPPGLGWEEAAGLGVAQLTALEAVRDHGRVGSGDRVLVIGASGGVGQALVQLARAAGATVTAVCSGRNAELVRGLGASEVVDHTTTDVGGIGQRFDVLFQVAGSLPVREADGLLVPGGRYVLVGFDDDGLVLGPVRQILAMRLRGRRDVEHVSFTARERPEDLDVLLGHVARGELRVVVDRTYDLADAAAAIAYVETGRARGKVVVLP